MVLSGRDLGWQEAQQLLMASGNFFSRPAFGLQSAATPETEIEVAFSPDLKEAVVVSPHLFAVAGGGGPLEVWEGVRGDIDWRVLQRPVVKR